MSERIDEERERKGAAYEEGRATGGTAGEGERGTGGIGERLKEGAKDIPAPVRGGAGGVRRDLTEERMDTLHQQEPGAMREEGEARLIRDYRVTPDYAGKTFAEGDRRITPQGIRSDVKGAESAGERIKEGAGEMAAPFRREAAETRREEIAERGGREGDKEAAVRERTPEDTDLERRMERSTAIPPIGDLDSIERARRAKSESEHESERESHSSRDYETGGTSGPGSEDTERHTGTTGTFGMTTAGGTSGTDRISDTGESKRVKERDAEGERDERA